MIYRGWSENLITTDGEIWMSPSMYLFFFFIFIGLPVLAYLYDKYKK